MNILAVDDEQMILEDFMVELVQVFPRGNIRGEQTAQDALTYLQTLQSQQKKLDYAFLDIRLIEMTGIELGKRIKDIFPEVKILFCTAYSEYALESYQMNAIGYLLKPVNAEAVLQTLQAMDRDWTKVMQNRKKQIRVHTFGVFEMYVDDKPVTFEREKTREILAYLIDKRGGNVTVAELAESLYENKTCDRKTMN